MIIEATERFSQRSTTTWFQKLSGQKQRLSGKVIPLQAQPESTIGADIVCGQDTFTPGEIAHLQNSASMLVTHKHEITVQFYRNVVKTIWWDHDRFRDLVVCEESRLLSSLLTLAEAPTKTSLIAFFLADNWVKYRHMSDIGETYDTITYFLNEAIEDVLGEYFTPEVNAAWRKALSPKHIFDRTLNACSS